MKKILLLSIICLPFFFSGCVKRSISTNIEIFGFVVDYDTSNPIEGVELTLIPSSRTTKTGSDGTFDFKNIEYRDQYTIQAVKSDYQTNRKNIFINSRERVEVSITLQKE